MPGAAATSAAVKSAASSAHTAASSAASSANKAASSAASSAAQKAASAKASIENADTGVKELNSIKNDVLAGKDGLGSIVNEVSKKNKKVDRFFHCLNPVGCACADANRVPIMAVASIIGAVVGGCALCGALGLSDLVMRTLPWGAFYNIDLTLPLMVDWICAEAILQVDNSPLRSPSTIDFSYLAAHDMVQNSSCWIDDPGYFTGASRESYNITYGPGLAAFFDERNTALWEQFPPTAEMPQGPVDWFANLTYFGAANVEAYPIGVRVGYLFTYAFNQWGMCGFPQESWAQKALQVGAAPNSAPVYYGENGEGTCRQWEVIGPWAPEKVQDCKEGLGVDAFSLIMGAFGGVIKVGAVASCPHRWSAVLRAWAFTTPYAVRIHPSPAHDAPSEPRR